MLKCLKLTEKDKSEADKVIMCTYFTHFSIVFIPESEKCFFC